MKSPIALFSGLPSAGKTSLCEMIEDSATGFTHIPLDSYIRPIPKDLTFLEWVRTPACIAWDHVAEHLRILRSGDHCFAPRPDWKGGRGTWLCEGGPIADGPGRRMAPASVGYLLPGTHSFSLPVPERSAVRIFVATPNAIIAERLAGRKPTGPEADDILRDRLGSNASVIKAQAPLAHFEISGTAVRSRQLESFEEIIESFFGSRDSG